MNELIRVGVQIAILVFGPLITARFLAQIRSFMDEIKDPIVKAELERAYNEMRSQRDQFKRDREDHRNS